MNLFKSRTAESLIEVIVAVVIVGISVSIALNLLLNTTDNTNTNRHFLIVDNLATEGIEAVRNIIYTNVLKHGVENAEDCWLVFALDNSDNEFTAVDCPDNKMVATGGNNIRESYLTRTYSNLDLHWDLAEVNQTLDLDADGADQFRLYTASISEELPNDYFYTSESENNDPSPYYRSIKLDLDEITGQEVTVTVRVLWRESGRVRNIERTTVFNSTNFTE